MNGRSTLIMLGGLFWLLLGSGLLLLAGCSSIETYGLEAVEKRKAQNDLQTHGTMAAMCDVAIGSAGRVMEDSELLVLLRLCWGDRVERLFSHDLLPGDLEMPHGG